LAKTLTCEIMVLILSNYNLNHTCLANNLNCKDMIPANFT
jgi:hypothetical protein